MKFILFTPISCKNNNILNFELADDNVNYREVEQTNK